MIWCTALNLSLDVVFSIKELVKGKTYLDCPQSRVPAGKGLNVARIVRSLGEEVAVVGILPENDEKKVTAFLEDEQILCHFYPVAGGLRVNVTLCEEKNSCVTHVVGTALNIPARIQHEFVSFAGELMKKNDYWCFTGSLPHDFSEDTYSTLIADGKRSRVKTVFDSRGAALKRGVRSCPLVVKPNLNELEEFFDEQIEGVHHIALKGKRLLDMGVGYVFISLGEDGMIALHKNDCLLCNAPPVQTINQTGCGDALLAGVLVAMKRQFSFSETCRMAVACGSAKAMQQDPGAVDTTTVWQLMEEVNITAV